MADRPTSNPAHRTDDAPRADAAIIELLESGASLGTLTGVFAAAHGGRPADHLERAIELVRRHREARSVDSAPETPPEAEHAAPPPSGIDFGFAAYELPEDPTGRPTSLDLFLAGVPEGKHRAAARELIDAVHDEFGDDRMVWSIKSVDGRAAWELYLYRDRDAIEGDFDRLRSACATVTPWQAPARIPANASIVSVEFDFDPEGRLVLDDAVDVYQEIGRSDIGSFVIAYRTSTADSVLRNTYQCFARSHGDHHWTDRLATSRFVDDTNRGAVTGHWQRVVDAHGDARVCVAAKEDHDGFYLYSADKSALRWMLDTYEHPAPLRQWVADHFDELGHLRYDLGFDWTFDTGEVRVARTAFYGWF